MIYLKSRSEIEMMRKSGKIVAKAIRECYEAIVPGKTTTRDLDALAERIIKEAGAVPSFMNYRGYSANTCISVNDVVIHGMPTDDPIMEGDIVDIDIGACLDGWHADSAWTFGIGKISPEAQRLLNVTKESLMQGIAQAKVGNRIGDISAAVQKYVEKNGYGVVRDLVGHGIGRKLHEEPHSVPNFGKAGKGEVLREGCTICIEPMVNEGTYRVKTLEDGWTVKTADGKLSAHFEHTIAITKDGPELLTLE
ncbi:MAG: type I methionyl aminopeptidase [Armatimonadetes bacterium 55-13]|nr:type I methionyl aminopeptidase [Armatimonadota bacterium]OJU64096.1 MAG: type I methionyl aminopeptidase [Armatimonadetes bacterium 55-13]